MKARMSILLAFLVGAPMAMAADNSVSEWFRSLKTPLPVGGLDAGVSCCSEADCKQRTVKSENGLRFAWIEEINDWSLIPLESRIVDPDVLAKHPFYQTVVCFVPGRGVICEAPPPAGG